MRTVPGASSRHQRLPPPRSGTPEVPLVTAGGCPVLQRHFAASVLRGRFMIRCAAVACINRPSASRAASSVPINQLRPGTRCSAQNCWKTGRGEASGPAEAGWAPSTAAAGWSLPEPAACAPCCWSQRPHPTLPAAGGRRARDGRLWCSDGRSSGLRRARATTEDSWGRPSPSGSVTVAQAGGQAGRAAQGCCCCC